MRLKFTRASRSVNPIRERRIILLMSHLSEYLAQPARRLPKYRWKLEIIESPLSFFLFRWKMRSRSFSLAVVEPLP